MMHEPNWKTPRLTCTQNAFAGFPLLKGSNWIVMDVLHVLDLGIAKKAVALTFDLLRAIRCRRQTPVLRIVMDRCVFITSLAVLDDEPD